MASKEKKPAKKAAKKVTKSKSKEDAESSKTPLTIPTQVMIGRVASRQGQKDIEAVQQNEEQYGMYRTTQSFSPLQGYRVDQEMGHHLDGNQNLYRNTQGYQGSSLNNQRAQPRSNKFIGDSQFTADFYGQGNYQAPPLRFPGNSIQSLKLNRVQEQIQTNLLPKREQILRQMQRIEMRIEEIKIAASKIEHQTREELEQVLERLKQASGIKISYLTHDLMELSKDIDQIDQTVENFASISDPNHPQCLGLYETVEHLVGKRVKSTIDIYPDDLPQEYLDLRKLKQQNQMLQSLMEFKNEVIWKLYSEQQQKHKQITQEFEREAEKEFIEWGRLVDEYRQELSNYDVYCCFCGIKFDHQLINSACNFNQHNQEIQIKMKITTNPPLEVYNTSRHFFGKQDLQEQKQ